MKSNLSLQLQKETQTLVMYIYIDSIGILKVHVLNFKIIQL